VLEISDVILIIIDIRHPILHLPPTLYRYVTQELGRKVVAVFNKVSSLLKFDVAQNVYSSPFYSLRPTWLPKKQSTLGENTLKKSIQSSILPLSVATRVMTHL
jgi:hypothetical protein